MIANKQNNPIISFLNDWILNRHVIGGTLVFSGICAVKFLNERSSGAVLITAGGCCFFARRIGKAINDRRRQCGELSGNYDNDVNENTLVPK